MITLVVTLYVLASLAITFAYEKTAYSRISKVPSGDSFLVGFLLIPTVLLTISILVYGGTWIVNNMP